MLGLLLLHLTLFLKKLDLFNARRRAEGGKFDDATARLYRCMEMCSTIELSKLGIENPAKPDYKIFAKNIV